ncbi:MAG: hypothetical protein CR967_03160 [Proteobacteria bacterium]|nr:MAG: hypothetical protein CR967_03160 [Pseudomonadota bacterium]
MKLRFVTILFLVFGVLGCARNFSTQIEDVGTRYVRVDRHVEIYDDVYDDIPYDDCYNKRVSIADEVHTSDPGAVIVGSVLGGILGHRLGRKSHSRFDRRASVVGGAVVGGILGNAISSKHTRVNDGYYETRRICKTRYAKRKRRILVGYDNIGYYNGHEIVKFSKRMLREIPVRLSIQY